MKIITLYDNKAKEPFRAGWGFSVLIETAGCNILFDTGADLETLHYNAQILDIDKEKIDYCFISHNHYDHTGGLSWLSEKTKIFYPGDYQDQIKNVFSFVLASREGIKEQFLVIKEEEKVFLFVGCSHPGITLMAREAFNRFGKLFLVLGGFHLFREEKSKVEQIANTLKSLTEYIAPSHCTGEEAKEIFRDVFDERYIVNYAGRIIEI